MVSLEKIISTDRFQRIKNHRYYEYAVDTTAMITFSTPIAMTNELFVVGMDFKQSLKTRAVATVVNLLTARIYGKFRNYIFNKCKTTNDSRFLRRLSTDILAFVSFQAPLYAGLLLVNGVEESKEFLSGLAVITGLSGVIGRPYGVYLDTVRNISGLKHAYAVSEELDGENIAG